MDDEEESDSENEQQSHNGAEANIAVEKLTED